jgi:Tol biopolymer transport system component
MFLVRSSAPENSGVFVSSFAKPEQRLRLLSTAAGAVYTTDRAGKGYLLWLRAGTLVAQEFDPDSLKLIDDPQPLADGIASENIGNINVTASKNGMLLYAHALAAQNQLMWLDSVGHPLGTVAASGNARDIALSPNSKRTILSRPAADGRFDLWLLETERGVVSRLTSGPGNNIDPLWSPDSGSLIFTRFPDLYRRDLNGDGNEQLIVRSPALKHATDWSRDGKYVIYYTGGAGTELRDLWFVRVKRDGRSVELTQPTPYLATQFNELNARFAPEPSPRWVAYQSDESGRYEVYVQSFPKPGRKFQISVGGGTNPQWAPGGGRIYFISPDNKLMATPVKLANDSVEPSAPSELFSLPGRNLYFEVAADGKRFLVNSPVKPATRPLSVIVNWPALLNKSSGVR